MNRSEPDSELVENHKKTIRHYIRAKDDNKPHLMKSVFTDSATLKMRVKTDNISFPENTVGLEAITDVLVRNFSQNYENVYTFCLSDTFDSHTNTELNNRACETSCDWLVCMTERDGGNVRVGAGRYDWHFDNDENMLAINNPTNNILAKRLAKNLVITIERMVVLTPEHSEQIFAWVTSLPYPFCDSDVMFESIPKLESLELIRK